MRRFMIIFYEFDCLISSADKKAVFVYWTEVIGSYKLIVFIIRVGLYKEQNWKCIFPSLLNPFVLTLDKHIASCPQRNPCSVLVPVTIRGSHLVHLSSTLPLLPNWINCEMCEYDLTATVTIQCVNLSQMLITPFMLCWTCSFKWSPHHCFFILFSDGTCCTYR